MYFLAQWGYSTCVHRAFLLPHNAGFAENVVKGRLLKLYARFVLILLLLATRFKRCEGGRRALYCRPPTAAGYVFAAAVAV
jgi:hypothetical protein